MLLVGVAGYLIGSIPFGLLLTRLAGLGDIRAIGSGNIGATNVLRTGNKGLAVATLLADGGKGAVAVILAQALFGDAAGAVAGLAAFVGHVFPVWLKFKGGKGVATFFGVMLALAVDVGLAGLACWLLVAVLTRYSSLAALIAIGLTPVFAGLIAHMPRADIALITVMVLLVYMRHEGNIRRLMLGQEPRIGGNKDASSGEHWDARRCPRLAASGTYGKRWAGDLSQIAGALWCASGSTQGHTGAGGAWRAGAGLGGPVCGRCRRRIAAWCGGRCAAFMHRR